jgi:hypothetical protein
MPDATPTSDPNEWDFFLSHAGEDIGIAREIRLKLEPPAKVFLDAVSLGYDEPWPEQLLDALKKSLIFVVIVSEHTAEAYYQSEEMVIANRMTTEDPHTRKVVAVYLNAREVPIGPFGLNARQAFCVPNTQDLNDLGQGLLGLWQNLKPLEARKNELVAGQRAALEKIGSGNARERLQGLNEASQLGRPLINVLLVMLVISFVGVIAALVLDTFSEVRMLMVAGLGSVMALLLFALLYVYSLALRGAMQIAQGNINGG